MRAEASWNVPVERLSRVVGACALAAVLTGCSSTPAALDPAAQRAEVDQRLAGTWRLLSYTPESALSPALLLGLSSETIIVRFDRGKLKSATESLSFERSYRIEQVQGERFTLWLDDEHGVSYESHCQFEPSGEIQFHTVTPPWNGSGVLARY